jgi:outer membrane biosynthesis protein TonB
VKKSEIYGLIGSIIASGIILLLLWLAVIPGQPDPPIDSTDGIEISVEGYGDSDTGGGQGGDANKAPSATVMDPTPSKNEEVVDKTPTVKQAVYTTDENTASLAVKQANKEKLEKEKAQKEAEQKEQQRIADEAKRIAEQKQKAIDKANAMNGLFGKNSSSGKNGSGGGNGEGKGTGNGTGQGNGSGDGTGDNHKGNPAGHGVSSGHSWSLKNRDLKGSIPKPSFKKENIEGLVTVNIRVDERGSIIGVSVGKPTTISDAEILNSVMEAAKNSHFTSGNGEVSGTITYNIKLK